MGLGAQDFRENFTFFGCRFLYPELLPDPVGVFSTYSRPDISHFGPKSAGFRGKGGIPYKIVPIFPLKGPVLELSCDCQMFDLPRIDL